MVRTKRFLLMLFFFAFLVSALMLWEFDFRANAETVTEEFSIDKGVIQTAESYNGTVNPVVSSTNDLTGNYYVRYEYQISQSIPSAWLFETALGLDGSKYILFQFIGNTAVSAKAYYNGVYTPLSFKDPSTGNVITPKENIRGWMHNADFILKFEVAENGSRVNVFYGPSSAGEPAIVAYIELTDNADLAYTNGKASIFPHYGSSAYFFRLYSADFNGTQASLILDNLKNVQITNSEIYYIYKMSTFKDMKLNYYSNTASDKTFVSSNPLSSYGLNDEDVVFNLSFKDTLTVSDNRWVTNLFTSVTFGMPEKNSLSTDSGVGQLKINQTYSRGTVYKGNGTSGVAETEIVGTNDIFSVNESAISNITVSMTGLKNGTLTVTFNVKGTNYTKTYYGYNFDGYFAINFTAASNVTKSGTVSFSNIVFDTDGVFEEIDKASIDFDYQTKNLTVSRTRNGEEIQLWIKENIVLGNSGNDIESTIWVIKSDFSLNKTFALNENIFSGDYAYVLIRVKDSNNTIRTYYTVFKESDFVSKIETVNFEGQSFGINDVIFLPKSGANLNLTFSSEPNSVISQGATFINNILTFSSFENTGKQVVEIDCDGFKQYININVYDDSEDYGYILDENVNLVYGINTLTINAEITKSGNIQKEYVLKYKLGSGNITTNNTFNDLAPGYYYYSIYVYNEMGVICDIYTSLTKFGNPEKSFDNIQQTYSGTVEGLSSGVMIGQENVSIGKEYQIIKWDAKGEYVVLEWNSTKSNINFIPFKNGTYKFQVRVRTVGFIMTYEEEKIVNVTVGNLAVNDITFDNISNTVARTPIRISVTNTNPRDDILYKFIVRGEGNYIIIQYFTLAPSFVWIPNKAGNYTIECRVISNSSYGYADSVGISKIITVI